MPKKSIKQSLPYFIKYLQKLAQYYPSTPLYQILRESRILKLLLITWYASIDSDTLNQQIFLSAWPPTTACCRIIKHLSKSPIRTKNYRNNSLVI